MKQNEVAELRGVFDLEKDDTLEVFLGHHQTNKNIGSIGGGYEHVEHGGFLEDVRFCIFW